MTKLKTPAKQGVGAKLSWLVHQQIFIPIAALLILVVFNLIADPSFFAISIGTNNNGDPVVSGQLITILNNASELVILAIGMTLVTAASGGQDISVGANIAIAGSVILRILCGTNGSTDAVSAGMLVLAVLAACVVSMLFGAFNGVLVAKFKIQPMVATLILLTAGRGIAMLITKGQNVTVYYEPFTYIGTTIPGSPLPTTIFIAALMVLFVVLIQKKTSVGLFVQAVGINANAARRTGLKVSSIIFMVYVFSGICADDIQVSATTEPMEMSIPPISRTKVMPMVAMIRAALSISRLQNTWGFMKPR